MAHSIGIYSFLTMEGNPDSISEQLEIITRPGVDGTGIRKIGGRGVPFQMVTQTDFATMVLARTVFDNYKVLKGASGQNFTWRSVLFTPQVAVLDVVQDELPAFDGLCGGLNVAQGGSGYMLTCTWTLVLLNP